MQWQLGNLATLKNVGFARQLALSFGGLPPTDILLSPE